MCVQAAAMQGVTDQRQAVALNTAIGEAEQVRAWYECVHGTTACTVVGNVHGDHMPPCGAWYT